jgi:hypothetical protein
MTKHSNLVFEPATLTLMAEEVEAVLFALVAARNGMPDDLDDEDRAILQGVLEKLPDPQKR